MMSNLRSRALGRIAASALAIASVNACAAEAPFVRVSPINAYRGYDDFQPDKDKAVLAKASAVDANAASVRIFQEVLPPGIELKEGTFGVAPGYRHRLIGKFAYSPGKAVAKEELVARVKKLAVAAEGDAAIIIFLATDATHFEVAQGVEAIIVHLDPRATSPEKEKVAPTPVETKSL